MSAAVSTHPPGRSSPLRARDSSQRTHSSSPMASRALVPHDQSAEPRQSAGAGAGAAARHERERGRSPRSRERGGPAAAPDKRSPAARHESTLKHTVLSPASGTPVVPTIKKERPPSPDTLRPAPTPTTNRPRPKKLDLSNNISVAQGSATSRPSGPLTSKETPSLSAMHDVGIACLSPGFQSHDPAVQHHLQRSMEVRDQQRMIIEARLQKTGGGEGKDPQDSAFMKPAPTSRRKGPPPGLSIHAPSAHSFANEPRVIQSAPLNQSFTGLRGGPPHVHRLSRQVLEHSHHHAQPSPVARPGQHDQAAPRLPPIQSVIRSQGAEPSAGPRSQDDSQRSAAGPQYGPITNSRSRNLSPRPRQQYATVHSPTHGAPPASAGFAPSAPPPTAHALDRRRERDYRSAEDAVQSMAGGREELLPKIVHYGGHQPPTPPSPLPPSQSRHYMSSASRGDGSYSSSNGRRRTREEYERDGDRMEVDPSRDRKAAGPFGEARDSPETNRRKKEEFMSLCARAWDLFHS